MLHKLILRSVKISILLCASLAVNAKLLQVSDPLNILYPQYPAIDYGVGKEAEIIKKGEYLAKMGDCIACHTNVHEGGKAFAGGLSLKTPFGTFYTPNITPDKETGIGKWSEKDFVDAMHEGKMPNGSNHFPVFPYIYFAKVYDDDLKALYAYLQKIPKVYRKNTPLPFPFNMPGARLSIFFWKLLFFRDREVFQPDPNHSASWNRGAYIVNGLGHCGMCHTPLNLAGAPKTRNFLTGAFIDGYWAPNITKYGLDTATHYQVAEVFIDGKLINDAGRVAGPMAEVNHNSLQYLTLEDKIAVTDYLKTVVSVEPFYTPRTEKEPTLKLGRQVYFNVCHICHQEGVAGAPIIGETANWENRLQRSGKHAMWRHAINGYNNMPAKGACVTCSDNEIIAGVNYILSESLPQDKWHNYITDKQYIPATHQVNGKQVYQDHCAICHDQGYKGAPKIGDKKVWKHLIAKNMDVLINNTIHGAGSMPARGGCKHCTNSEIISAVKYLVDTSIPEGSYNLW